MISLAISRKPVPREIWTSGRCKRLILLAIPLRIVPRHIPMIMGRKTMISLAISGKLVPRGTCADLVRSDRKIAHVSYAGQVFLRSLAISCTYDPLSQGISRYNAGQLKPNSSTISCSCSRLSSGQLKIYIHAYCKYTVYMYIYTVYIHIYNNTVNSYPILVRPVRNLTYV